MDITDIMTKYSTGSEAVELDEKPWAPKHGPQRLRLMTNGQIRRAQAREIATNRRHETKRFRRGWLASQLLNAYLRGGLQALGLVPYADGRGVDPESRSYKDAEKRLTERYGSVEKALEQYEAILRERRA